MLVEPARPQSWRSGSSCPSSGEGFASPAELRGAADAHRSGPGPSHRAGGEGRRGVVVREGPAGRPVRAAHGPRSCVPCPGG